MCLPTCFSCVWHFATLWTVAHQAPMTMEFSRQEYWSGLPWPPPGNLPNPAIKPASPALQVDSSPQSHWRNPQSPISKNKRTDLYIPDCTQVFPSFSPKIREHRCWDWDPKWDQKKARVWAHSSCWYQVIIVPSPKTSWVIKYPSTKTHLENHVHRYSLFLILSTILWGEWIRFIIIIIITIATNPSESVSSKSPLV